MGMDVYGKKPSGKAGEYFRASIWQWPAIYSLTTWLCSDLLDEKTTKAMAYNDGAGPNDPEVCREMAKRILEWLKDNWKDLEVYVEHEHTLAGQVEAQLTQAGWTVKSDKNPSSRSATREHIEEWTAFLQDCGGFEVW